MLEVEFHYIVAFEDWIFFFQEKDFNQGEERQGKRI